MDAEGVSTKSLTCNDLERSKDVGAGGSGTPAMLVLKPLKR